MGKSVKKTYARNQRKKAVKKDLQTIFIVSLISVLAAIVVALVLLFFFRKNSIGKVNYPSSPLTQTVNSHYSYIENTDVLPNKIQMPTEPVIVSVGGSERYVPYNGRVYLYSPDLYLSVYELYGSTYDLYSTQFVSDLYGGSFSSLWTYEMADSNTGYFNGYRTEHQCGVCAIYDSTMQVQKNIYLVSLTMDMGLDKQINITVSTSNKKMLYTAEELLETVGYTMMDISNTSYTDEDATHLLDGTENETGEAFVGAPIISELDDEIAEDVPRDVAPTLAPEGSYTIEEVVASPEPLWSEYYITVTDAESIGDRLMILSFDNKDANIKEGILSSPDKTLNTNFTTREDNRLIFNVTNPVTGKWTVKINSENPIGTYQGYCVDKGVYMLCNQDLEKTLSYAPEPSADVAEQPTSSVGANPPTEVVTNVPIMD